MWLKDKSKVEPRLTTFFLKKGTRGVMIMAASDPGHAITANDKQQLLLSNELAPDKTEFIIIHQ
jgi:hypothetical protein